MADANPNTPAPDENQPQLPLENQEPLITSDPEAAKTMKAAETQRAEVKEALESVTPEVADKATQTIEAAGPMQQLQAEKGVTKGATPPPLHDSPAYKAQKAKQKEEADAIFADREAERAAFEAEAEQKVAEAMERKVGEMPEEIAALTNEKIEAWLGKHDAELKQGLVEMFKLNPEDAMSDQELARFENELTPEKLQDPELLFAPWFNRLEEEGKELPVDEKVAADVLTHVIQNDLPPTATK